MKIRWKDADPAEYLAGNASDDYSADQAGGLRLSGRIEVDVATYVGGANAEPVDRGNLLNEWSFMVWREQATQAESDAFVLEHAANLTKSGTLEIVTQDATVYEAANAVVQAVDVVNQTGVSIAVQYTILSGAITEVVAP